MQERYVHENVDMMEDNGGSYDRRRFLQTGERIRRARKAAGFTQDQVAARLGKSKGLVANYESGYRTPDDETLSAIAETLGVTRQSLEDRHLDTVQDVLEVLFKNGIALSVDADAPHAPKLIMALEIWNEQLKALKAGDISPAEYTTWRASFEV